MSDFNVLRLNNEKKRRFFNYQIYFYYFLIYASTYIFEKQNFVHHFTVC